MALSNITSSVKVGIDLYELFVTARSLLQIDDPLSCDYTNLAIILPVLLHGNKPRMLLRSNASVLGDHTGALLHSCRSEGRRFPSEARTTTSRKDQNI